MSSSGGAAGTNINWYEAAKIHMEAIGLSPQNWTNRAVVAAALRRGVRVTKSKNKGNVVLRYRGKRHWWRDGLSSLNPPLVRHLSRRKDALSSYLLSREIPMLRNQVFCSHEPLRAWQWGRGYEALVVKPVGGTGGKDVHINLLTKADLFGAFEQLAHDHDEVLVEEFRAGREFRFLTVRNRVVAVCERVPANVTGDGRSTIRKLVQQKNRQRWQAPSHKKITLGVEEQRVLRLQGMRPEQIPKVGEVVYLRLTSNVHTGGDAVDVTDRVHSTHIAVIERAARLIRDGGILGFDVLLDTPESECELAILEVNAGPMISLHHLPWEGQPRDVAGAVVEAMFPHLRKRRSIADWYETEAESARGASDVTPPKGIWISRLKRRLRRGLKKGQD